MRYQASDRAIGSLVDSDDLSGSNQSRCGLSRLSLTPRHMSVDLQCEGNVGVAEPLADHSWILTVCHQMSCVGVS